jgi:putative ABC transport system permease protein
MIRKLAFLQLRKRPVTTSLLLLIIALALGISIFLTSVHQSLQKGLTLATEPFSLLVSSRGSQHQLVLNTVFLQDRPLSNLPYEEVNKLKQNNKLVKAAIPMAFGDSYNGYRIVGASKDIFSMKVSPKSPNWLTLREGRPFEKPFETVIGASVADQLHLKVGSTFVSTHGLLPKGKQAHKDHPFVVVGILKDVHGPYNQAILTSIESVWEIHEHKDHTPLALQLAKKAGLQAENQGHDREVTAILVEPVGYSQAYQLASQYQSRKDAMLVFPAQTIVQFFNLMGRGEKMWQPIGIFLMLLSIVIVVITSYLSTLTRLREYAILRALGARVKDVTAIWLWQNAFLIIGGTVLGALFGFGAFQIVSHLLKSSTAITMPFVITVPMVLLLLGAVIIGMVASLTPMSLLGKKLEAAEAETL